MPEITAVKQQVVENKRGENRNSYLTSLKNALHITFISSILYKFR